MHTQNFYDEMSLNHMGTGVCGGQQGTDARFSVNSSPPPHPPKARDQRRGPGLQVRRTLERSWRPSEIVVAGAGGPRASVHIS